MSTPKVGARGAHNAGKALADSQSETHDVGTRATHDAGKALDDRKADESHEK